MPVTVSDILARLDALAPFASAESWDNVGLLVGTRNRPVRSILIALDPTNRLLDEAIAIGADTIITHHPIIFRPLSAIDTDDPNGRFLETALRHQVTVIASHTNLDSARNGVSDALADLLGVREREPLLPAATGQPDGTGLGRIGRYPVALSGDAFLARLLEALQLPCCDIAGRMPATVQTVALCGGSGGDFAEQAKARGADLYVTAEVKHHVARWAEECSFCVIDGTHYATERPTVQLLARSLTAIAREQQWKLTVTTTTTERHPFTRFMNPSANNHQPTGEGS
ncbi:Nif3-like dinuclear metal center hexameric protein [Desulfofustis limnaeus]|jgi:dinuclear metal center YbgI/SA1388 family protein|uniref:GTP cyclohydrolase 1 type 2 n=1 Tax=Desulfofustis limnaeus TaxID=2740163 RepID=A0ABM7WE17_9BACT|nr:Nif3-like dinuclear metal center hexameric protein [Desulfofustis limnaeus]MDX9895331.1 Nif3-like dinuclear metal center hexameric protein [Desulfofustis sp.]BDD89252.1 GTP cyclohydrolase 1 type 2 [Desulfofustis limnaeus]